MTISPSVHDSTTHTANIITWTYSAGYQCDDAIIIIVYTTTGIPTIPNKRARIDF